MSGREERPYRDNHEHLEDELRRLDLLIRLRTLTVALQNATEPETQTARATYITAADVEWLLDERRSRTEPAAVTELRRRIAGARDSINRRIARTEQTGTFLALPRLARLFDLSAFEQDAIVICLAPELRRKYDRLYAYLQDDITRKRPSVDLILELLCETDAERWSLRALLSETAALLRSGLLRKADDSHSPSGSSGLAQFLQVDPRILGFVLGSRQLDARLSGRAQLQRPAGAAEPPVVAETTANVFGLIERHLGTKSGPGRRMVFYLRGPHGVGRRELVWNIARRLGCPVLTMDVELLLADGADAVERVRTAFREGLLQQAILHFTRADLLLQPSATVLLNAISTATDEYGRLVFLSGEAPWTSADAFANCLFQAVTLPVPDVPQREAAWVHYLGARVPDAAAWASQLAVQFRLTPGQIRSAIDLAENTRRMGTAERPLSLGAIAFACRQQSNHKLGELAVKVERHAGWDDLVLPEDQVVHLREICDQVRHRYTVFGTWGFDAKLSHGKGLSVMFAGPSGTGKTMAAEVLARELELDLYKVDLSGVVSKYVGETEKNLSRIFAEAESSNAILFFDEADALFGKRTEVSDAHDRYANIETSYLLQKMEQFEGVVILATNLRENMDDAFTRRIRFVVDFPFPDETHRRRIWQSHFPREAPLSSDVDCGYLAREFQVAGGSIKNIVLNAAFIAAAARGDGADDGNGHGAAIGMSEILRGARREFAKMGKVWNGRRPGTAR